MRPETGDMVRRLGLVLLAAFLALPALTLGVTESARAVAPGAAPGLPTPFVASPIDLGPREAGHPASSACLGWNSVMTAPVGERTFVALHCGLGLNSTRVFVSFIEPDGTRTEPWALVGASNSGRVFVRDVAVDEATGDVGVVMGLPDLQPNGLGLARYTAATSSWTVLTPQALSAGAQAPCVDPNFNWGLELGAVMAGGDLTVVGTYSREVTPLEGPWVATSGEVRLLTSTWSGGGCAPAFRSFVVASGPELLPGAAGADAVDLDVSQGPGAPSAVVSVNHGNGTSDWSDDTFDVLRVVPADGTVTPLVDAAPGRARAIDLVENSEGSSVLVSPQGVAPASVMAVPLDGGPQASIPGAQYTMPFVEPDPFRVDARVIPEGWDRATVIGRSAVMVFDAGTVSYVGDQGSYGPYRAPRSPQMRVAWHDGSQPGGVRFAPVPTSESGDDVQWRIPDPTWIRVVAIGGTPVLTGPCGLDESARWWQCVSSWTEGSGWSPPRAVRQGVVPVWALSGGPDPVLIASMTDASVRLVTRDVESPVLDLQGPSDPVPSGSAVNGSLVASDTIDGGELACSVEVDGTPVATSSIPLFDDNAAYPEHVPGPLTLEWTSPLLEPGAHEARAWCTDRAGNRSADAAVEFEVLLLPPLAPTEAALTASDAAAQLTWSPPEPAEGRAVANGYRIELRQAGQSEIERTVSTGPDERLLDLAGLSNGVDYQVRIVALSEVGDGGATAWLSTTPLGSPAAPRDVVVKARPASAFVAWQAPSSDPARRKVGTYAVQVKDPVTGRTTTACTTTATSCTVTGLVNGRTVAVRVGSSPSSFSAWVNVRPIGVPAAPKIANVVWRTNGRAQVYWKPSTTGAAPVQGYRILVNGRLKGIAWSGMASSHLLTGQRQGVKYVFTVQAFNPMGRASTTSAPRIRPIP